MEDFMRTILVLFLALTGSGCGYSSPKQMAPQPGIVPVIAQIMPNTAKAGGPAFTLTVNGSNFNANAVVNWNGAAQNTTHPATNQLTVQIPASDIATAGMVQVSVTNPGSSTPGGPYGQALS
jgi:IPT/TIG domain-containing protein